MLTWVDESINTHKYTYCIILLLTCPKFRLQLLSFRMAAGDRFGSHDIYLASIAIVGTNGICYVYTILYYTERMKGELFKNIYTQT